VSALVQTTPRRIRLRRSKGWRLADASNNPNGVVNVTRPGKWGNPFAPMLETGTGIWRITCRVPAAKGVPSATLLLADQEYPTKDFALEAAVRLYRLRWENHANDFDAPIHELLAELAGKDLACWCGDGPCHADVLLDLANLDREVTR
jgi:hypothetical protein